MPCYSQLQVERAILSMLNPTISLCVYQQCQWLLQIRLNILTARVFFFLRSLSVELWISLVLCMFFEGDGVSASDPLLDYHPEVFIFMLWWLLFLLRVNFSSRGTTFTYVFVFAINKGLQQPL